MTRLLCSALIALTALVALAAPLGARAEGPDAATPAGHWAGQGERHGHQVDFELLLSGDVLPGTDFTKDHLVLVVTGATGEAVSGDFHLKSNFVFDLTMRPGALELRRAP